MHLDNSNEDLITGVVTLLRENVSGWSTNSEYGVENVWGKQVPEEVENEFPRGAVDIVAGNDFDLSLELDVKLREVTLRVVVFGENAGPVERLIEDSEDAIGDNWESYVGDWHFREVDGFAEISEEDNDENILRYNRHIDMVFETVKD